MRLAALAALALVLPAPAAAGAAEPARTIVSLEFDFTSADQFRALKPLERHDMHATFFVNSSLIGRPGRMTHKQLRRLQEAGNEIGGSTLTHARLPDLPRVLARRQICVDRKRLLDRGYAVDAFAYPFGAADDRVTAMVRACGYSSARLASGIVSPGKVCISCPYAETVPPRDAWATRMPAAVQGSRIAPLLDAVRRAQANGGGWVQLLMHRICRRCNRYAISRRSLDQLLRWLARRDGVEVRTVSEVMDARGPSVRVLPPTGAPPSAWDLATFRVFFDAGRGVERVRYFVDDRLIRVRNYGPWRLNWYVPDTLEPGVHSLQALLEDRDGNVALSPRETFLTR